MCTSLNQKLAKAKCFDMDNRKADLLRLRHRRVRDVGCVCIWPSLLLPACGLPVVSDHVLIHEEEEGKPLL